MRQITLHQLVEQASKASIEGWMPFQIICDGEVIAVVQTPYDVEQAKSIFQPKSKAKPDVPQAKELRFSKSRQASGGLAK